MSTNTGAPFNIEIPEGDDLAQFVLTFLNPAMQALNANAVHRTAALDITGGKRYVSSGKTLTSDTPLLDLAAVFNAPGVVLNAVRVNVTTDTASDAASKLLDLQVGGTSKFSVRKDGVTTTTGDITIEEVTAGLNLFSPGLALNEKRWVHNIETNNLVFRAVSDDSLSSAAWLAVNRTGIVINRVDLQTPALRISDGGSAAATGRIRLENNQFINWRNVSNAGDIGFRMNASDQWELSTVGAANSANAGGAAALPATPAGYWQMMHNGTPVKIPLYQV